jgi:hypothetical protein
MKTIKLLLVICLYWSSPVQSQTIWNSNSITFEKIELDDVDIITQNVILTRGANKGIYNSAVETESTNISPSDTEWATGNTSNLANLEFDIFTNGIGLGSNGNRPPIDTPLVVHLITDDIYIDIEFKSWGSDGSFKYVRTTSTEENNTKSLLNIGSNGKVTISDNNAIYLDGLSLHANASTTLEGPLTISKVSESITSGDNSSIPKYYEASQTIENFDGDVSISYTDEEISNFDESLLVLQALNESGEWIIINDGNVDLDNNVVTSGSSDWSFKRITLTPNNESLSVNPLIANDLIEIYPNPSIESITIKGFNSPINATIINMNGREMIKSKSSNIDVSRLSTGMYILNINDSNNNTYSFKIVKK